MSHRKSPPSKGLGRTFHQYLKALDSVEYQWLNPDPDRQLDLYTISAVANQVMRGEDEGGMTEEVRNNFLSQLLHRWANDAVILRESFKFRSDWQTLALLADSILESPAGEEIDCRPPFQTSAFVIDNIILDGADGDDPPDNYMDFHGEEEHRPVKPIFIDQCVLLIDTRQIDNDDGPVVEGDWYKENDIADDDDFISLSCYLEGLESDGERGGGLIPIEVHVKQESMARSAITTIATPAGTPASMMPLVKGLGSMMHHLYETFLLALAARYTQHIVTPGVKPHATKAPRPRKKQPRIFYEHTLVRIDPTMEPELLGTGSRGGGRKRLHPVRGFWRHYDQPIKTGLNAGKTQIWVPSFWRGDKNLGVITHDYEVVTEDETDDD